MKHVLRWALPLCLALGCGGSKSEAETADSESAMEEEEPDPFMGMDEAKPEEPAESEPEETADEAEPEPEDKAAPEPEFPADASVAQAIAAVPQGAQRLNLDQETLARPLQNPEVYAPCKPGSQKFSINVAVWNGRAVGVDVKTKNPALASCLKEKVRELTWDDKVPSLNMIEVGF